MSANLWQCLPKDNVCQDDAVSPGWREEKKQRTRDAIVDAALALFARDGYDAVTIADVARAAGVGERTVYRYVADKEDILFADDTAMRTALAASLRAQPRDRSVPEALRVAAHEVGAVLADDWPRLAARAAVIAATPALQARERLKQDGWRDLVAAELTSRGVPAERARLHGAVVVACFAEALTRCLDGTVDDLPTAITTTLGEVGGVVTPEPADDDPDPDRGRDPGGTGVGPGGAGPSPAAGSTP
jgi:AcrR family transcriptional regulator